MHPNSGDSLSPLEQVKVIGVIILDKGESDDMGSKQVRTEIPVGDQTISKYSLVGHTVDSDAGRKSLLYH